MTHLQIAFIAYCIIAGLLGCWFCAPTQRRDRKITAAHVKFEKAKRRR